MTKKYLFLCIVFGIFFQVNVFAQDHVVQVAAFSEPVELELATKPVIELLRAPSLPGNVSSRIAADTRDRRGDAPSSRALMSWHHATSRKKKLGVIIVSSLTTTSSSSCYH